MDTNRKIWNQQQKMLRQELSRSDNHPEVIELFLRQHAMVHSTMMSQSGLWSFEDEIFQDISEETVRNIPRAFNHSIAWIIWHIARIEDVTMNLLVAGSSQTLHRNNWLKRMKIVSRHTGNAMDAQDVADLSTTIDIEALRDYRLAVGRRTREIVKKLQSEELNQKVAPNRLQQVKVEEAVPDSAWGIVEYWGGRNIAGLLLMPATRHNFLHLNEARRVKQKCH
jgi:hypothetical protein